MDIRDITGKTIDCAIRVHKELGPGLLESIYEACLTHSLMKSGLRADRQVAVPVTFEGTRLDCGVRLDLVVEDILIVELKAVDCFAPIHYAQAMTYLKLTNRRTCLLFNFNVVNLCRDGLRRIVR